MNIVDLDRQLLAAHSANDMAELVRLYQQAGAMMIAQNDVDAGCFYLTHAYIFALEIGHSSAPNIHQVLIDHGREE